MYVPCTWTYTIQDTFKAYYEKHLHKRLLSSKGYSDDLEKSMISKFKVGLQISMVGIPLPPPPPGRLSAGLYSLAIWRAC